ncbi:PREDICTED: ER membrane protein complex subunit 1 isoform X2 [Rhagoletis zephyria]|uniref:ER membrane protein complex subunit 1 isoform X2 n=1 Tax=Rhagoletis zephyria TaxID=28612 RepID=UPI000811750C|nr:PREDICTED: ER membrane protein complex subunit 1 isoform X2 [Rhagoletis zephyria]
MRTRISIWNGVLFVTSLLLVSTCVNGLYEDQIKKFDWRVQHIGAIRQAHLELNSLSPRLLVSTQENVVAVLEPKTGKMLWRQVLENSPRGELKLMQVGTVAANINDAESTAAAPTNSKHGFDVFTVQGHAPALVRGWNVASGNLEWEWSLMPLQTERAESAFWFYKNGLLYHVIPTWRSHIEVTPYFATSGHTTETTGRISAAWISADKCVLSGGYYSCLEGNQLIGIDLTANQPQVLRKTLAEVPKDKLRAVEGISGAYVIDNTLVSIHEATAVCNNYKSNSFLLGKFQQRRVLALADVVNNVLQIRGHYVDSCEPVPEMTINMDYPDYYGTPTLKTFACMSHGKGCLYVLGTEDEAILAVQQSKIRWVRQESLANIVASEFIDLPLGDAEGTLENEMKGNTGDISSAFFRRISTQALQIKSIFLHVVGLGQPPSDTQKAGLVRDSFGLHKMLVVLTRSGKIFGIDNINGKHHWQQYLRDVQNFVNQEPMRLLVQRTSKHFPLQPLCTIVAKEKSTGNGVLFRFNPINGKPAEGGLLKLNYKIKQLTLLAESEKESIKGLLLLDAQNNVAVYPQYVQELAHEMYLFTADKSTATLDGFFVEFNDGALSCLPIWKVRLDGHNEDHQLIAIAAKNPLEHVHSQGRVLADRSVLYKYINPNLIAAVTQATDPTHKYLLNTYLIDAVSGLIVFSMTHRRARVPVHIVHSENWLAYSYYNDKVRRTEITTIELYEGKIQANSTVWSSMNAPPMPMVERQSYIVPTIVETMRETITERGITNKHVLIGTTSGAIIEMPWALLDPRRPITSNTQGREEGAIPYIPELPLPTENIINYNQTIARLSNIFTAPSGLESTCLVLATGLDMFVTRVAPSKTFDLLKEDFDYILITVVLLALTSGSLVAKHLASRKQLKQAWK